MGYEMSLSNDIERVTHIPCTNSNRTFVPLTSPNQRELEQQRHNRHQRPVRNEHLLLEAGESSSAPSFGRRNELEISSYVKKWDMSNTSIEEYFKMKTNNDQKKNDKADTNHHENKENDKADTNRHENKENDKADTNRHENKENDIIINDPNCIEMVLRNCGLSKNAAISGLLKQNIITLDDLKPSGESSSSMNQRQSFEAMDYNHRINLVPSSEDPDIMVNPLQQRETMESLYSNIDMTVDSVGRRMTQTPRQFYTTTDEKDAFNFVRRNRKTK